MTHTYTPTFNADRHEAIGSVFGNNVEDGIGAAGALDAVVDEVMPVSGAVSGGGSGARGLGAHDEEG